MAVVRGNQGENNTDGFEYQQCTLLYCIEKLRQCPGGVKEYEIGSAIAEYGALDDVVFKAVLADGREVTYAIQVKNSSKMIDPSYLCEKPKTYIFKYFQSFLTIKKTFALEHLGQLIIWTNMKRANNVLDWFEDYKPIPQEIDILGAGTSNVPYKRYRLTETKWKEFEEDFVQRVHPRVILVEKFVAVILKKEIWNSQRAAKDHFRVMAQEIIECNGNDSKFKESFIQNKVKLDETKEFRKCFERIMKERFKANKYGEFKMDDLNSDSYKKHLKLSVDAKFQEGSIEAKWSWNDEPTKDDVREFFKRFVFYVEVADLDKLKKHVASKLGSYEQWCTLWKGFEQGSLAKGDLIDKLIELLQFRKKMDSGPYLQLQFTDTDELRDKIDTFLSTESETCLCIKASQNVDCTVSRLIRVLENKWNLDSKRYLVFNYKTYTRKCTELEAMLKYPKLVEVGLECIIITHVPSVKTKEISNKLSATKIILVGEELMSNFDDVFDVGLIDDDNKTKIEDTEIQLSSEQTVAAIDIFSDDLFRKDYYQIVLELYKTEQNKPIEIPTNELEKDPHYRSRFVECIDKNGKPFKCDLLKETKFRRFIICDQPGMGKTTELLRIGFDLRSVHNDHLIVHVDCKAVASKWSGCITKIVTDSLTSKSELINAMVDKMFEKRKVILLLDGYDEVSSTILCNLEAFLNEISGNDLYKSLRIYIATRPHCLDKIKKILSDSIECHLKPFSESDQLEYLKSFWNSNDENLRETINKNTKTIIDTFRAILKRNQSLIGIPLQTYMIAVLYEKHVSSDDLMIPKSYEIGSIYKDFIDIKFKECTKRTYDITSTAYENLIETERIAFLDGHVKMAQAISEDHKNTEKMEELCTKVQHYGLVRLRPSVGFTHQTYLEYFLTLYFLQYKSVKNEEFVAFMKRNLCESRTSIATKFLDFHIGSINPNEELKSIEPNSEPDSVSEHFKAPPTARLHPKKIMEFHLYLGKHCSADEQYTLIRSAFNISVFNVLEVLYDSLPSDVKSNLRFSFGSKPETNFINLKLLGENQILHLLKLLWRKHPDDLVRSYLSVFDDSEEDFIEVACRKPFVQVLKWLTTEMVPRLTADDARVFEEYVQRRFQKYFELVVQHNNVVFLKEVIHWVQTEWSAETAKQFIQDKNVMLVFVTNVETKASTKPFTIESRVEMVNVMFDQYQRLFDDPKLSDQQCIDVVNKVQNAVIKKAFEETFLSDSYVHLLKRQRNISD